MVALGLFGCIVTARRLEVNIKLCALFFCAVVERFILLVQRNFALEDIFRKVFRFEFMLNPNPPLDKSPNRFLGSLHPTKSYTTREDFCL